MDEVGPSDVARLDPARVAGILTARGGATAHSAIVARALGIPALVGAGAAVLLLAPARRCCSTASAVACTSMPMPRPCNVPPKNATPASNA
jgi:phosphoenolpyruvate-protein kinase (PTS system EI component)